MQRIELLAFKPVHGEALRREDPEPSPELDEGGSVTTAFATCAAR